MTNKPFFRCLMTSPSPNRTSPMECEVSLSQDSWAQHFFSTWIFGLTWPLKKNKTTRYQTFQVSKMEVRENPPKKYSYKVQYLHFRYLKLLVRQGTNPFGGSSCWGLQNAQQVCGSPHFLLYNAQLKLHFQ